ncbi:MAG: TauD/TfdA family dioxygenase [Sphingomonas fennica]
MSLTATPILPRFGAEITGIDITRPLGQQDRLDVLGAMDDWAVNVYRATGLTDETHVAFSRIFGHPELCPTVPGKPRRFDAPELFDAGNITRDGVILADEMTILHKKGDRLWHTDSSFMHPRAGYSLLLAHEVPSQGGETFFADTRSAYDDLPDAMKAKIDGLEVDHSLWWSRRAAGFPFTEEDVDAKPFARQPLVMTHPRTGRKALYVAAHGRDVVGMPRDEGRALLKELIDHATKPEYTFAVKWGVGDLVIWDNLATMHRGGDFDHYNERRDMRRTTIREGAVPEVADDPYGDYFRASYGQPQAA